MSQLTMKILSFQYNIQYAHRLLSMRAMWIMTYFDKPIADLHTLFQGFSNFDLGKDLKENQQHS